MNITLKLFSALAEHLPPDADDNAVQISTPPATTPHMLIDRYHLPRAEVRVVMVNGEFVPLDARDTPLRDGDVMSVWPSIQGG